MKTELKPCPQCNSDREVTVGGSGKVNWVCCDECNYSSTYETVDKAIQAWNAAPRSETR